ncbi:MAG: DUF561 domain-containing protein [Vagococcus sp.]|uniref:DUF561 domain-containing protein n=1 Tax=Vagococcus TaxID=2737 RepID=UPI002FCBB049
MTKITDLLGIEYPIFQGAMAQISTSALAGAVSEAGGLGIIASGGMTAEKLREEIKKTREMTNKPFAVNVMLMMENCDEIVDVIIESNVKIITTGAGTPKKYMPKLKEAGVMVIPVVPSAKLAKKMEDLGVDAVVAEGTEAGGHIGEVATMPLIAAVTKAVSIPVLAAGGISDGRGLAAAFSLGAVGVQMGTVYLASKECPIPDSFKEKVIESVETSTVVTGRRNGAPVRTIRNTMTDHYIALENQDVPREELEKLTMGSLAKAVVEGDVENGSLMAGQILGNISSIRSVFEIHQAILDEYRHIVLPEI